MNGVVHGRNWNPKQALLLNSTVSTTSWTYFFSEQDGVEVVILCVGWCLKVYKLPKFTFINAIIFKNSVERILIFFHMLLSTICTSKLYQWLRICPYKNTRFVGVNVGMSARNHRFQTNHLYIIIKGTVEIRWLKKFYVYNGILYCDAEYCS